MPMLLQGGHALMAMFTEGAMPVHKATIVPRGQALGMVSQSETGLAELTRHTQRTRNTAHAHARHNTAH